MPLKAGTHRAGSTHSRPVRSEVAGRVGGGDGEPGGEGGAGRDGARVEPVLQRVLSHHYCQLNITLPASLLSPRLSPPTSLSASAVNKY